MNRELKSIQYAFIANGFQIFNSDEDDNCFIVSRLICWDCQEPWYTNLTECFICGTINPYLYRCTSCGKYQSITKSTSTCDCGNKLYMMCPNEDCISNKNQNLQKEINALGGVFNKNSGMQISQQYCIKCGGHLHYYRTYKIQLITISEKSKINLSQITKEFGVDFILIKIKGQSKILYKLINPEDQKTNNLENVNSFSEIIDQLY